MKWNQWLLWKRTSKKKQEPAAVRAQSPLQVAVAQIIKQKTWLLNARCVEGKLSKRSRILSKETCSMDLKLTPLLTHMIKNFWLKESSLRLTTSFNLYKSLQLWLVPKILKITAHTSLPTSLITVTILQWKKKSNWR